jgi:hypothetical protein
MSVFNPVVLRRPWRAAFNTALLGAVDLLLLLLLLSAGNPGSALLLTAALAAMLYGTAGTALARIEIDSDGVVVRNGWKVRRLSWSQVLFISPATDDPAFRTVGVAVLGGSRIRCFAVGAMRWESAHSAAQQRVYQKLQAHLLAARADGRAPAYD